MFRHLSLWTVALSLPLAASAQTAPFSAQSIWINDHARFAIQSIDRDGGLAGTYENFGSGFGCAGIMYPVTGWVDGERITFSVLRKEHRNCTSVQAWTGFVRGEQLLVEFVAAGWNGAENAVVHGTDRYRRQ